jgi:hypothetical protein
MLGLPGVVSWWRATSDGPSGLSACTTTSSLPDTLAHTRSSTKLLGTE